MPGKTKETNEINEEITVKKSRAKSTSATKAKTKTTTAKTTKIEVEKATPKKTTKAKEDKKNQKEKIVKDTIKSLKAKKSEKTPTKKATTTKKPVTVTKESTKTSTKTRSTARTKSAKVTTPITVEYYDLPYKYNQTVVKVLYQNPTTLFVYWEISDSDIENYKKTYGDNFFETTRPVLVVYNDTMNYSFEIGINDFANSWYFNINDNKCNYRVALIRRPITYNEKIKTDYIHITSSNKIESPNDRILFSTNEPYTVYFRNTKNNIERKVNLPKLLKQLNLANKNVGFPIVRNVYDLYKNIYNIENVEEFSIPLTNPSSGNPSSHGLSPRFI